MNLFFITYSSTVLIHVLCKTESFETSRFNVDLGLFPSLAEWETLRLAGQAVESVMASSWLPYTSIILITDSKISSKAILMVSQQIFLASIVSLSQVKITL